MSNTLDAIPAEARAVIVDELTRRDPALLAELRDATRADRRAERCSQSLAGERDH